MKTIAVLLLALIPFVMSTPVYYNGTNFVVLMKISNEQTNYIVEHSTSLEKNMAKTMYTSDDLGFPAFNVIENATAGITYFYDNTTETCEAYYTTPSNMTEDFNRVLENAKFIGYRGLDHELYNISTSEGENTLVYGKWAEQDGDYYFSPLHLQQTIYRDDEISKATVEFLDQMFIPGEGWKEPFYNPACEGVTPKNSANPTSSRGILGRILPQFDLVSK